MLLITSLKKQTLIRKSKFLIACAIATFSLLGLSFHVSAGEVEEVGLKLDGDDAGKGRWSDRFIDPEDGCFDVSDFLADPLGFIPVVVPITEPTVGVGAALALVFIDTNEKTPDGRGVKPNITAVGGFGTENGTQGYFGMHSGHWLDGKLDTLVIVADVTANLDFYGSSGKGLRYTLDTQILKLEALYRLGDSRSMLGLGYVYGEMDSHFKTSSLPPEASLGNATSTLGGLSLIYNYDSRDNMFTQNSGFMGEMSATFHDPSFGASSSYQRVDINTFYFHPVTQTLVFGLRATTQMSFGDVPFYQRPFVQLRGVPVMRYQGEHVAFAEAELRWKIMNRVSLIGFAGAGLTSSSYDDVSWHNDVFAGGVGIRYELARKQGLHMGLDVAFSDDDTAVYVVFGSAWLRP